MNLDVICTVSGFFFGSTILKRAYQQFHVREKSLIHPNMATAINFRPRKFFFLLLSCRYSSRNKRIFCLRLLLGPSTLFLFPSVARLCPYAVLFIASLNDSGSTNICLFRRSVFLRIHTQETLPTTSQFTRKHERMGSDDPCGVLCACVYRLFFSKKVVHFSASYENLSVLVGFFTEIIYHPPREIGGVKLASHGERKTTLS
jgi:hypothetical protein